MNGEGGELGDLSKQILSREQRLRYIRAFVIDGGMFVQDATPYALLELANKDDWMLTEHFVAGISSILNHPHFSGSSDIREVFCKKRKYVVATQQTDPTGEVTVHNDSAMTFEFDRYGHMNVSQGYRVEAREIDAVLVHKSGESPVNNIQN